MFLGSVLEIIPFLKLHLLDKPSKPKTLHRHSNEAERKQAENRKKTKRKTKGNRKKIKRKERKVK